MDTRVHWGHQHRPSHHTREKTPPRQLLSVPDPAGATHDNSPKVEGLSFVSALYSCGRPAGGCEARRLQARGAVAGGRRQVRGTIGARATRAAEGRAAAQPADGELTASPLLVVSSYFLNSISRLIGVPSPVSMRRVFGGQNVVARDSGSQASPSKLRFGDLDATPSFLDRHAHGLGACHWCQHWHATPSTWHSPTLAWRGHGAWLLPV